MTRSDVLVDGAGYRAYRFSDRDEHAACHLERHQDGSVAR